MWQRVRRWLGLRGRPAARRPTVSKQNVEQLLGMAIRDLGLYERALRHRSVLRGIPSSHLESNERLEFLGDAVLGVAVAERLYNAFPDRDEGFLTRTRAKLVNGEMLADLARAIGLAPLILLSANMEGPEGRDNPTILADALEAVIGAVYLDLGFEEARVFVFRLLDEHVDLAEVAEQKSNYKSLLLEAVQAEGRGQPVYRVVAEEGPSHDRRFTIDVYVEDEPLGRGQAPSKKRAEQLAAREALGRMRGAEMPAPKA
jgi:ribonuclease III